jgi:uncharacterized membrane-anchored protein
MAKIVASSRFAGVIVPVINPVPIFHELLQKNIEGMEQFNEANEFKKEQKKDTKKVVLAPATDKEKFDELAKQGRIHSDKMIADLMNEENVNLSQNKKSKKHPAK